MRTHGVWMLGLAALALACGNTSGTNRVPELYVTVQGDVLKTGPVRAGEPVVFTEAEGGGSATFHIGNLGDAELTVLSITVEQKNANMTVKKLDTLNFTHPCETGLCQGMVINAGDTNGGTAAQIQVVFKPGATTDDTETVLLIEAEDELLIDNLFRVRIQPPQKAPALRVSPDNYIFLDATAAKPQWAEFVLSNEGNAQLALGDIRFETLTNAFTLGPKPNRDTLIDPTGTGSNLPVKVRVSYKPVNPPEDTNMVVYWGPVLDTGVACGGEDADLTCRTDETLCPPGKVCPYTCGNGKCQCTTDAECKSALCTDPTTCTILCLTGVCREPSATKVRLQGESQPGKLEIQYADQMSKCVDFTEIVAPGVTCTKIVKLMNTGEGQVTLSRPKVAVPPGSPDAYSVKVYKVGGAHGGGDDTCGAWEGEEITDSTIILGGSQTTVDVAITYEGLGGATGVNGELVVEYQTPQDVEARVPLCGGLPKGQIDIAPSPTDVVGFDAGPDQTQRHTVVILNRGNGPLTVKSVSIEKVNQVDPEAFTVVTPFTGTEIAEGGLFPIEVEFSGDFAGIVVEAWLNILYVDPTASTPVDQTVSVHLRGRNDFCLPDQQCVTLPKANPGKAADHAGKKVGDTIVLDGSASVQSAGTYSISDLNGYTWFVVSKPATSKVFPKQSYGGAQLAWVADAPGDYGFVLWVVTGNDVLYFSDESTITVTVAP